MATAVAGRQTAGLAALACHDPSRLARSAMLILQHGRHVSQFKGGEADFVPTKLMTRLTYTLDEASRRGSPGQGLSPSAFVASGCSNTAQHAGLGPQWCCKS